jgi:hypothetical protein
MSRNTSKKQRPSACAIEREVPKNSVSEHTQSSGTHPHRCTEKTEYRGKHNFQGSTEKWRPYAHAIAMDAPTKVVHVHAKYPGTHWENIVCTRNRQRRNPQNGAPVHGQYKWTNLKNSVFVHAQYLGTPKNRRLFARKISRDASKMLYYARTLSWDAPKKRLPCEGTISRNTSKKLLPSARAISTEAPKSSIPVHTQSSGTHYKSGVLVHAQCPGT